LSLESALALCFAVHAGALVSWFGALALPRAIAAPSWPANLRLLRTLAALALASGLAWAFLQTGVALDDAHAMFDRAQLSEVLLGTNFGRSWLLHLVPLAVAAALMTSPRAAPGTAALLLTALALAGLGASGHAAGAPGAAGLLQEATMAAHLLATGAWLGALPGLRRATRSVPVAELAQGLRRFSRYGAGLVAVILATGGLSACWRLGTVPALWESGYGRLLLIKIAVVAGMIALAGRNRNVYTPALDRPESDGVKVRRSLARSIAAETALGVIAVLLASVLGSTDTPG
jgi:putative copper resistance protein D